MLRFYMIFLMMVIPLFTSVSQEDEEDIPVPPRHRIQMKIGGAGGFTQNILFLDLAPLNSFLTKSQAASLGEDPILLLGGQGYGYIMLIPNLRIGGLGAGGSIDSKRIDTLGVIRDVNLSVTYGGVSIDYVIPIVPRLDVTLGLMLGSGGMTVTMTRDHGTAKVWDDIWDDYGIVSPASDEFTRRLAGSFFVYQPSLQVEYALLRWIGVRLGVGYYGVAGGDWRMDDKYEILNVPSSISGKGWMLNTGIFVGTFVY
jgi:hypothetical protein